ARVDVRHGRVAERAHDVDQCVGGPKVAELLRADALSCLRRVAGHTACDAWRETEIAVGDLRVRRLLRFVHRRELVDPVVGHFRDADVRLTFGAGEGARRGVPAGQQVEEGRLADVRQTGDRRDEIHVSVAASTSGSFSPKIVRATSVKRSTGPVAKTRCRGVAPSASNRCDWRTSRTARAVVVAESTTRTPGPATLLNSSRSSG